MFSLGEPKSFKDAMFSAFAIAWLPEPTIANAAVAVAAGAATARPPYRPGEEP